MDFYLCTVNVFFLQCGLNTIKTPKQRCWVFFEASSPFIVSGTGDKIIGFVNNTDNLTVQERAHGMPSIQPNTPRST